MNDRNWEAELKKIDRAMESVSDEAMFPSKSAPNHAAKSAATESQRTTTTLGVFLRLGISVALGIAIVFWPYAARCGFGLSAYLAAVVALVVAGGWSAVWTWRHRSARGHLLSLLLVLWGLVLGAIEVLPRTGYAIPSENHPATWVCQ
jgi:putative flippase GtrA